MIAEKLLEELRSSASFRSWRKVSKPSVVPGRGKSFRYVGETFTNLASFRYVGETFTNLVIDEKHFSCSELAKAWGISPQTIRELFRDEEGVLKIGSNGTRTRRAYKTLRIPLSVAERVHSRLSA